MSEIDQINPLEQLTSEMIQPLKLALESNIIDPDDLVRCHAFYGCAAESLIDSIRKGSIPGTISDDPDREGNLYIYPVSGKVNYPGVHPDFEMNQGSAIGYASDHASYWPHVNALGIDPQKEYDLARRLIASDPRELEILAEQLLVRDGRIYEELEDDEVDAKIREIEEKAEQFEDRKGFLIGLNEKVLTQNMDPGRQEERGELRLLGGNYPLDMISAIIPLGEYERELLEKIRLKLIAL